MHDVRFPTGVGLLLFCLMGLGCDKKSNPAEEGPLQSQVVHATDANLLTVDHPEEFTLVPAAEYKAASALHVTGVVNPDISRTIPVISLASGRVVAVLARVGDFVRKGQLLVRLVSDDISAAYSTYHKAVADEVLANTQLKRAQLLYDKGAIPKSQLEIAQDTEDKAKVDVQTALDHLHLLGVKDPNGPQVPTINIYSPANGVIIQQNVTQAAPAINALNSAPSLFTIADLSHVWVVCDVYENQLAEVRTGQTADIRLNAYPDRKLSGVISEIDAILDPNIRTAKVRIQVENPSYFMRVGMFATATFHGRRLETHASIPKSAVLELHDRSWAFLPAENKQFRRVQVTTGDELDGGMVEVVSGLQPGQKVVSNALELQDTVEQ